MQTVLITGGTGLVGSALSIFLQEAGYRVIVLTRKKKMSPVNGVTYAHWDPAKNEIDTEALRRADHIVHLAGANITAGRWTKARKKEIRNSRTGSTRLLYDSLGRIPNHVKTLVSASATGYYGHRPDRPVTEEDPAAAGFTGAVCAAWEAEVQRAAALGKRVVILRTGPVLNTRSGLVPALTRPLKFGLAVIPGTGEQWLSWIHLRDLVRLYAVTLSNESMEGIFNAVSPFPVTLQQLTNQVARAVKGRFYIPLYVPAVLLKLFMGEKGMEILKSCKVSAEKVMQTGFEFSYPTIGGAVEEIGRQSLK